MFSTHDLLANLQNSDRVWHLGRIALLQGLQADEIRNLSELAHDEVFAEQQVIYNAGDPGDRIFFLNRGTVRLGVTQDQSREKTVEYLRGGDVFGLEAIGENRLYDMKAVAHEESWVSVLGRTQFISLAQRQPSLAANLARILIQHLARAHQEIRALCFLDIEHRLVSSLLALAARHGQRVVGRPNLVRLRLRLSHDFLARLTGANRPYLSNIMSEMKKKGWILYERQHLLLDLDALAGKAAECALGHGGDRILHEDRPRQACSNRLS